MTEISFYVGKQDNLHGRLFLACRVAQKAYDRGYHIHIHTDSLITSRQLDDLLWSFSPTSFIPHAIIENADKERIIISHDYEPHEDCDYLINLSNEQPKFFSRFTKMAEILDQTPDILTDGRKRYAYYRDRGYNLQYYQL
ncbi:DNA polymerase III subunit chi [Leucothrix arctica]|uniref:DNA polymerase III subunit chi n=1 Tax=Leucothrix arctica TaxID=1481894 RepID=A0A317C6V1_9GAMM|nr:DNA polymerase III subunit chi [Leucothrix arctica]PWQ93941.1 DNA polymerase III subunit chi [Leucothrix arctica]